MSVTHLPRTLAGSDLRAAVRTWLDGRGTSVAEAALGIGMSPQAIAAWLRGDYRGDNARVERLAQRWLATRREVEEIRSGRVDRHAPLSVTENISVIAMHAQATADVALVYGAAGAGKTWALRRYCTEHAEAWYVAMSPAVTTPASVLGRIAREVDAGGGVSTAARLEIAIVERLRGRDALLVVDEAHHLTPALIDQIRCVYDAAACGLVLAGNEPLWGRLAGGDRAAQLVSRVGTRYRLRRPSDEDAIALAAAFLGREPAGPGRRSVLEAGRAVGALRAVRKLISQAAVLAAGAERKVPTDADLVDAASYHGGGM